MPISPPRSAFIVCLPLVLFLHAGVSPSCAEPHAGDKPPHAGRDTTTGRAFELRVKEALESGGYTTRFQVEVGRRPNGGKHFADVVASKNGRTILVSLKWQQVGGTAEQKIPYELICLAEILAAGKNGDTEAVGSPAFDAACLVMGGDGWTLRDWYLSDALEKHLPAARNIPRHTLESFLVAARAGKI